MNSTQRRLAVVERMYSGDLSQNYLNSLSILDPEVPMRHLPSHYTKDLPSCSCLRNNNMARALYVAKAYTCLGVQLGLRDCLAAVALQPCLVATTSAVLPCMDMVQRDSECVNVPQNLPVFTHEVQRWIHDRQNPEPGTCGQQKYLLGYQTENQGLGSTIHVAANFLGNAMHVRWLL